MATQTTNLGLTKPAYSDVADIMVINNNMDILDGALAKMVTTDSPQTITGSKTFTGTVIVNNHNLRNAVTTDETQTLTGEKTHTANIILKNANFNPTGGVKHWSSRFTLSDGNNYNIGAVQCYSDGNGLVRTYLNGSNPSTQVGGTIGIEIPASGSAYGVAPIITDSAPSNAIVTKYNVMSTDGKLNNLVHTIGEEQIYGDKYFHNKIARKIDDLNINNIPTSNVYPNLLDFSDNQGNSVGYIGAIETAGQSYRLLNLRAKGTDGTIRSFSLQLRFDRATNLEVLQMAWSDGTYSTIASRTVQ